MAKVGTSNPDRTISLKRLQCVVENKHKRDYSDGPYSSVTACEVTNIVQELCFVSKIGK